MTTTSRLGVLKMRLPEVIRTKKTLAVSNPTPKNERLPRLVGPAILCELGDLARPPNSTLQRYSALPQLRGA
jgi:hypothetical protein